jgi:CubicO group peptidase (beta-lactamase class C family)
MWLSRWLLALPLVFLPLGGQVVAGRSDTPAIIGDGWERADPSESGFDAPRLHAQLSALMAGGINIHSVIVVHHGRLVAECYRRGKDRSNFSIFAHVKNFGPTDLHDVRSVGKSVISLLLGIAKQQGKLGSLATPAIDYFPEFADLAAPALKRVTLEHLLTMTSGFQWNQEGGLLDDEHRLAWKASPCRYVFSRPIVAAPGSRFDYNSGDNAVLADILGRVTGMPWKEFARTALFEPLGITNWEWENDLRGRPMSYSGLRLCPRDMAKIGLLVANRGQWRGRQLVPADWIEASLKTRVPTSFDGLGYGFQWWTGTVAWQGRPLSWGAAFGNGSQRIFVVPNLDLTIVVTAGAYGDLQAARRVNTFLKEIVATIQH